MTAIQRRVLCWFCEHYRVHELMRIAGLGVSTKADIIPDIVEHAISVMIRAKAM